MLKISNKIKYQENLNNHMKKRLTLLLLLFLIPSIVNASLINTFFRTLNIPGNYSMRDLIFLYVIPFVGTVAIVFGLLTKIEMFPGMKRINLILAIIFGLALLYTGAMLSISQFLYKLGGFGTTVAFFVLFAIGVWMYGKKKVYGTEDKPGWKRQYASMEAKTKEVKNSRKKLEKQEDRLDYVKKRLRNVQSRISRMAGSPDAKKRLIATKAKLEKEKVDLEQSINNLKERVRGLAQDVASAAEEAVE